jgi:hypothetical protein
MTRHWGRSQLLQIIGLLAILAGVMLIIGTARADRMVLSPDGDVSYMDLPSSTITLEDPYFSISGLAPHQACWCTDQGELTDLLERALKYIPDHSRIDTLDHTYTLAVLHLESPESRQRDAVEREQKRLKEMEEITKLHNEIKELIRKLKGEKQ